MRPRVRAPPVSACPGAGMPTASAQARVRRVTRPVLACRRLPGCRVVAAQSRALAPSALEVLRDARALAPDTTQAEREDERR